MKRRSLRTLLCMGLMSIALYACEAERYFGPYDVAVPTAFGESSAARTFEMPLDATDVSELEELDLCLEFELERELPCICDYPGISLDEQDTRIDYRLAHEGGQELNALVWIGVDKRPQDSDPDLLPDLPWIEVLGEHLHRLNPGQIVETSFLEEEIADMELAWAIERHSVCGEDANAWPAPISLFIGVSLPGEEPDAALSLEWVVRVRDGG
ncbi:MAG: hypothetical protein JRF33_01365 [Deltaproteobacteria bacterium]|nr:hypothetical protein [Deltaproteobacteria bacterium]